MNIKDFISKNDVDYSNALIDEKMLEKIATKIGVTFGEELTEYVLKYGYLAFDYIEFYGINSRQGFSSDMIKQTLYLHKYYPKTMSYIALENQGDGDYYLVNTNDEVYEFISEKNIIVNKNIKLFEYISQRFQNIAAI